MATELGEGLVLRTSEMAIHVQVEGEEIWIPKSCLHDESEIDEHAEKGDEGAVSVKTWWAEKEGWA